MKQDKIIRVILMTLACTAILGLAVITVFIFKEGVPIILRLGGREFFLSADWDPKAGHFGIRSMILGSLMVTGGAMVIGVTFSLGLAVALTEFSPPLLTRILKPVIELLAGIPSVVYGFVGVVTLVPLIQSHLGGPGLSVLAASIVLGIMVLPTVTSISVDALRAVPRAYREGSIALGATRWQTVHMVLFRAARSGIVAAIILGMGRAVGETMAVIMVSGNTLAAPRGLLEPVRTLTANIALEMGYASGDHRQALFATGVTLFAFIMILNTIALAVSRRQGQGGRAT
ncbi:MAG: phosphate ABC transporter permease subunit PstC [Phycisphaerae bacterium]